jgi:hypothetical protein
VSPPWFAEPNAVRLQPRYVRRRPDRRPRAAGVSPPWVSVSQFTTALALTHGRPPRVAVPVAGAFASRLTTGGLRPPLLRCGADVCRRNNDFCDAQTHVRLGAAGVSPPWFAEPNAVRLQPRYVRRRPDRRPRAAGVSPPWFAEPNAVRLQPRYVRRRPERQPRAAGVSPPWLSNAPAHATVFRRRGTFAYHGWLTPAAPGCTTLVCCEMRDSQCGVPHTTESGGRQAAVLTKRPGDSQKHPCNKCPRLQPDYGKGHTLEGDGCSELYQACNPAMERDTPRVRASP